MADYDIVKLNEGLKSVDTNIQNLENALLAEKRKRDQYMQCINDAISSAPSVCIANGHQWEVTKWEDETCKEWRERKCNQCGDVQRVGN